MSKQRTSPKSVAFGRMTRRTFIKTASGVVAVSVLGLPEQAHAQASSAIASATPGLATQRIDGFAKVTGQKVFARDFSARDMAGWPANQWHALYVYALTTDHKFLSLDLSGLSAQAQPTKVIYGDMLSGALRAPTLTLSRDLHVDEAIAELRAAEALKASSGSFDRPDALEFDLIIPRGEVPNFLGQAVALMLFDTVAAYRAAHREMQFKDSAFQVYAIDTSRSDKMGEVFPPQTTYVKYNLNGESFSYVTADPSTYMAQVPAFQAKISAEIAANPEFVTQEIACDLQATDPMFMEPESGLVWYDRSTESLNIVVGTQSPDGDIADLLGMFGAEDSPVKVSTIAMTTCYPGGGFGGRDSSPFTLMLALAAPFTNGAPVRLALDRFQQFRTGLKKQGTKVTGALTASPDMKLQLVEMNLTFDGGGRKNLNPYVASLAALCSGGAYALPMANIFSHALHSQNVSAGSQRGFGGPQAYFAVEIAMDDLAAAQGWDPVTFRRANLVADDGTTVAGGPIGQELRLSEMFDIVEAHPLWAIRAAIKEVYAARGLTYGTGVAVSLQAYGTSGDGMVAAVLLSADGTLTVQSDAVDMGNGSATTLGVAIGEYLGANATAVDMAGYTLFYQTGLTTSDPQKQRWANPDWTAKGVGSSSACLTGLHQVHTVKETARALFEGSIMAAARALWNQPDWPASQTAWVNGALTTTGGQLPPLPLADVAAYIHANGLPTGMLGHAYFQAGWAEADYLMPGGMIHLQLDGVSVYSANSPGPQRIIRQNTIGPDSATKRYARYVWAPCINIISLTVDQTNGEVTVQNVVSVLNAGRVHVPELVSGQSQGGVAMALSSTLMEEMPPGMEGPANGLWNLNRYHMARMEDVPLPATFVPGQRSQELIVLPETPGDRRAGRGIAEAVMCSVAPAISNALKDAVGRRYASLPITPKKVLEGLSQ